MSVGLYQNQKYTAYFYPNSIVICTRLQCFRISYLNRKNRVLLDDLTTAIMRGKIESVSDMRTYNGGLKWENCSKPYLSQLDLPL